MDIEVDHVLDAKGLACPMPIVKTKKYLANVDPGEVVEVQATDKGSTADLESWAKSTGEQYLGTIEADNVLKHYIRKSNPDKTEEPDEYPYVQSGETLEKKVEDNENITVLDVREPAEYAFGHIPGAKSIPLGEIDDRTDELADDKDIYVVCRTGRRSDFAAQKLQEKGFQNVIKVEPGMAEWNGPLEKYEGGQKHE